MILLISRFTSPGTINRFTARANFFQNFKISKSIITCMLLLVVGVGSINGSITAKVNGNWSSSTTWTGGVPVTGSDVVIPSGYTVTLDANTAALNSLTIASGGQLTTTGAYTVSATTIFINGYYKNGSTGLITCPTMNVAANATYEHFIDGGTIPTATWDIKSNCLITGATGTTNLSSGYSQNFGNFTWSCPGQTTYIAIGTTKGNGTNTTMSILGNLLVDDTGSNGSATAPADFAINQSTLTIGGNLTINSAGVYRVCYDLTTVQNILGDVIINGGQLLMNSSDGTKGYNSTLNVAGDFNFGSGYINSRASTNYTYINNIIYNGAIGKTQIFTSGTGTIESTVQPTYNTINFIVNSGTILQMGTGATPGILAAATSGTNTFTILSSGTLGVTSPAGITLAGTTSGNILTNTRTYSTGANYIYNGTAAQVTGIGLTQNIPANLTINNSAGVKVSNATTISGLLTMSSGTLDMADLALTAGSLTGATNLTNSTGASAQTITIGSDNTSPSIPYSGIISNGTASSVALTKVGTGILTLSGANTYTGATTISAGTLKLGNASALGSTTGSTTVTSGAALDLNGTNYTNAEPLTINGTGISSSGAVINSSSTGAVFAGLITLGSTSSIIAGTGTINISNTSTITGATFGLTLGGAQGGTLASILGTTSGTLTKQDAGTWTLSGTNTYTGATTISAGTLKLGNVAALGASAGITSVTSGAVLDLNGFSLTSPDPLTLNGPGLTASPAGALTNTGGNASYNAAITLGSSSTITATSSGTLTSSGAVTGAYALTLDGATGSSGTMSGIISTPISIQKNGAGTWTLSGANTYTGLTNINTGTIMLGASSAVSTAGPLGSTASGTIVAAGAVLDLNGFSLSSTATEPLTLNGTGISGGGVLINSSSTASTYNGAITLGSASTICTPGNITLGSFGISGGMDLTKTGNGTLNLGTGTATLGGLTNSAGTFTSTSGTLSLTGNFTNSGTFSHNSGTVTFNGTGAQSINSGGSSFYSFTVSNTGNTCSALKGITVLGTITTNSGSILDMGTNALNVTTATVAHSGTIKTQNTGTTPITTGIIWGGTVQYDNASGGQTIMAGTYGTLNNNNTSGTNNATGAITANYLNVATGGILNMSTYALNVLSNVSSGGTIRTQNTTQNPISSGLSWGTVTFEGSAAQTVPLATFSNLNISNSAGVSLSSTATVTGTTTISPVSQLIIPPATFLNSNTITTNNNPNQIYIQASTTGGVNGSLIFNNTSASPVQGTVELYSIASKATNYKWQFIGIPIHSLSTTSPTFDGGYIRQMHEENNDLTHWVQLTNMSPLTSFTGYEVTQLSARPYVFQGQLENGNHTINLTYSNKNTYNGENLIGNSYTAAIDISNLSFTGNVINTVYIFNTGSKADWTTAGSGTSSDSAETINTAGRYNAIPIGWAGRAELQHQIPSMQAFLVIAKGTGATLTIPYSAVGIVANSVAQRSKEMLTKSSSDIIYTIIDVKGSRFSDRMWLFTDPACTHSFDNGWDGEKFMGSGITPQIYAMEQDGNYQVNSVDDINNTYLGFRAGEDSVYTLTFTHQNLGLKYGNVYLVDSVTQQTVDITASGTQYTFQSLPTDTIEKRFKIITNRDISTNVITPVSGSTNLTVFSSKHTVFIDNKSDETGSLYLYDITGRLIQKYNFTAQGVTTIPTDLPPGNYLVKGITKNRKITKNISL